LFGQNINLPVVHVQRDPNLGIARQERWQHGRQQCEGEGIKRIHPQGAARHAGETAKRRFCLVHVVQNAQGMGVKQGADIGQAQVTGGPLHQHGANRGL